ncbi:hypothetical protein ACWTCW_01110 [Listeria ivanovii subsp. ivanovii]
MIHKKYRWYFIGIVGVFIIVVLALYQYKEVNKPWENFKIEKKTEPSFTLSKGGKYSISNISTSLQEDNKDIQLYELELTIENTSKKVLEVDSDNMVLMSNRYHVNYCLGFSKLKNKSGTPENSSVEKYELKPGEVGKYIFVVAIPPYWKLTRNDKLYFCYFESNLDKKRVYEYNIPVTVQ